MSKVVSGNSTVHRLTALWALSESGLGGLMHAMKIPFTGFIVGGFAVIIISLIAYFSKNNFRVLLQATGLVLLIKAGVSPQSPLPAYIAVGFQGLMGAILFSIFQNHKTAALIFGCIALIESAVQQVLIATLLFGKSLWVAINLFSESVLKDFHLTSAFSGSRLLISGYLFLYGIWGIYLGFQAGKLPQLLQQKSGTIEARFHLLKQSSKESLSLSGNKKRNLLPLILVLLFIASVFYFEGSFSKVYVVVFRTIAIILLVFYIVRPLVNRLFQKFNEGKKSQVNAILMQLPELGSLVKPAFTIASEQKKGLHKYKEFVFVLIVLSLMDHSTSS